MARFEARLAMCQGPASRRAGTAPVGVSSGRNAPHCASEETVMAKMKVAQIAKAGADFEIVEREIPQPGPGHVRIRVQACGVCHSDVLTKEGGRPGLVYPRVPGHEVAGVIDEAGPGVTHWKAGQKVGVGWHGGHDGTCLACRRGDFVNCASSKVTGLSYDGGYQEYMVAPVDAVARMPESLDAAEAAPLMCAGITTFNALRHSGAGRREFRPIPRIRYDLPS